MLEIIQEKVDIMLEITQEQIKNRNVLMKNEVRNIFRKYEISDCEYEFFGLRDGCQCIAFGQLVGFLIFFAEYSEKGKWKYTDETSAFSFAYAVKEVAERLYRGESKIELLKELAVMFKSYDFTIKDDYVKPTKHTTSKTKLIKR